MPYFKTQHTQSQAGPPKSQSESRLPILLLPGAFFLSFSAGFINVISFMGLFRQAISHTTGNITRLGASLAGRHFDEALTLSIIVLSFMIGSAISGYITFDSQFRTGRRYGVLLMMESVLVTVSTFFLMQKHEYGEYLLSMACGLQNAMATSYSGAVVRTTHMTGIITDLGILIGQWLRNRQIQPVRFALFLLLIAGFLSGGVIGQMLFLRVGIGALFASAVWLFVAGFAYYLMRVFKWHPSLARSLPDPPSKRQAHGNEKIL